MLHNIKKILAGATGLEPATSAVTGQRLRGTSPLFSSCDSTPRQDKSGLKHRDSTPESKQFSAGGRQDLNLPQTVDFAQGDSDSTPDKGCNHRAKPVRDSDSHPLELARLSRQAILRVGDFEPLPAIGHRRRRTNGRKTGRRKIVLFLALTFLLAACGQTQPNRPFLRGAIDANGNPAVPR